MIIKYDKRNILFLLSVTSIKVAVLMYILLLYGVLFSNRIHALDHNWLIHTEITNLCTVIYIHDNLVLMHKLIFKGIIVRTLQDVYIVTTENNFQMRINIPLLSDIFLFYYYASYKTTGIDALSLSSYTILVNQYIYLNIYVLSLNKIQSCGIVNIPNLIEVVPVKSNANISFH